MEYAAAIEIRQSGLTYIPRVFLKVVLDQSFLMLRLVAHGA